MMMKKKNRVTLPRVSYSQTEDMPLSTNYKGYTYNDYVRDSVLCEPVVFVCYKQANSWNSFSFADITGYKIP